MTRKAGGKIVVLLNEVLAIAFRAAGWKPRD